MAVVKQLARRVKKTLADLSGLAVVIRHLLKVAFETSPAPLMLADPVVRFRSVAHDDSGERLAEKFFDAARRFGWPDDEDGELRRTVVQIHAFLFFLTCAGFVGVDHELRTAVAMRGALSRALGKRAN